MSEHRSAVDVVAELMRDKGINRDEAVSEMHRRIRGGQWRLTNNFLIANEATR